MAVLVPVPARVPAAPTRAALGTNSISTAAERVLSKDEHGVDGCEPSVSEVCIAHASYGPRSRNINRGDIWDRGRSAQGLGAHSRSN